MTFTKIIKPQTLKGFRDFLPEEMRIRNYVLDTCRQVFESFGFEPLETPALEYSSTLLGKYGTEADKLVYTFNDKGGRNVGLRYDLTVPVARILAQYNQQIALPFKRYQMQTVWRSEKPQKGRYREFTQCDIDIFGVKSPLADAEIIAVIYKFLKKIGLNNFTIQINSRKVLFEIIKAININEVSQQLSILQSIDKINKQGKEKVKAELKTKGLSNEQINILFNKIESINLEIDNDLKSIFYSYLPDFGLDDKYYKFVPTMARGLDYYTGPIFETIATDLPIGSLTGGGRYDKLISLLGGPNITGTGTTIGIDRICEIIKEKNLLTKIFNTVAKVLILNNPNYLNRIIKILGELRDNNINCEFYLEDDDWSKQLKYANKKGIPYVIILGPDEVKANKITLKNMGTGEQKSLTVEEVIAVLK